MIELLECVIAVLYCSVLLMGVGMVTLDGVGLVLFYLFLVDLGLLVAAIVYLMYIDWKYKRC